MPRAPLLAAALGLAACSGPAVRPTAPETAPEALRLVGDGYPEPGAPCRRAGESPATAGFLDDAADLVACPPRVDPLGFMRSSGGMQVATVEGWYLFTVPRR